jgi:hypothetical protein
MGSKDLHLDFPPLMDKRKAVWAECWSSIQEYLKELKTSPRHKGSRCKQSWMRSVHALQRVVSPQRSWSRCCVTSNVRVAMDTNVVVSAALLGFR